jgi:hypothetical protein
MSVIVKHASTMYVLVSRSGDLDNYIIHSAWVWSTVNNSLSLFNSASFLYYFTL